MLNLIFIIIAKYFIGLSLIVAGFYFLKQPWNRKKEMVWLGILTIILVLILARIGGAIYYDPRPFVVEHFTPLISHDPDNGFPSDHTLLAAAIGSVFYVYNKRIGIWLLLIAILIGLSRIYVGVHHPIDIIGSILISAIGTYLAYKILEFRKKRLFNAK